MVKILFSYMRYYWLWC